MLTDFILRDDIDHKELFEIVSKLNDNSEGFHFYTMRVNDTRVLLRMYYDKEIDCRRLIDIGFITAKFVIT